MNLLAEQTPASFIAFDLLALDDDDLTGEPFSERRAALEAGAGRRACARPPHPGDHRPRRPRSAGSPSSKARAWTASSPSRSTVTYQPDKRVMFKIKHTRTADCVVAGYRVHKGTDDAIGSLLLGLYTDDGALASVGVIGAFPMATRKRALRRAAAAGHDVRPAPVELGRRTSRRAGTRTPRAGEGSRWNANKDLSFIPLRPERVVEVRYDHMEGARFRHTAQFVALAPGSDAALVHLRPARRRRPPSSSTDIVPGLGRRRD